MHITIGDFSIGHMERRYGFSEWRCWVFAKPWVLSERSDTVLLARVLGPTIVLILGTSPVISGQSA